MYTVKENEKIIAMNITKKEVCNMLEVTPKKLERIIESKGRYKMRYKILVERTEPVLKNKETPMYLRKEWNEVRMQINPNAKVEVLEDENN